MNNNFAEDENVVARFEQVENIIMPIPFGVAEKSYVYGKAYEKQAKSLAETILQVLKILRIEYTIKGAEYCIKCVYTTNHHARRGSLENLQHDMVPERHDKSDSFKGQHQEEKEHRFTKREIKFNVQIYAKQQKGVSHVIDLQLTQGHPFVFFPFVRRFYAHIDEILK